MLLRVATLLPLWIVSVALAAQPLNPKKITKLPAALAESSGIAVAADGSFWSHNDSGDGAFLYHFDVKGRLLQRVFVENATNIDWEALQFDPQHRALYIGDFGNNAQMRRNLTIYRLPFDQPMPDTVQAEKMVFQFANQTAFPPAEADKNYDAEAFIVATDSIYILTKDFYQKPYIGHTSIYRLPLQMGSHTAIWVKNLPTNGDSPYRGAITDAAQSTQGATVLLAYQTLFYFPPPAKGQKWHDQTPKTAHFRALEWAQREAIAFDPNDPCRVWLSSEQVKGLGGLLYRLDICRFFK